MFSNIIVFLSILMPLNSAHLPKLNLVDGNSMPVIGLGTYQLTDDQAVMSRVLSDAIDVDYRLIDTAYVYQNEELIGKSLKEMFENNKTKREDLFITSKVWNTYHKRSQVVEAMKLSLNLLGLHYLDLSLVHWPLAWRGGTGLLRPLDMNNKTKNLEISVVETWKGMEDAYRLGLAKSIGVSNFNSEQLTRILKETSIKPVVNQIEIHPYLTQEKLVDFCKNHSIEVIAYCPLGRATPEIMNETILTDIATKHNKTVPQVILRWLNQRDIIAIPKTSKKDRLKENINIFDFQLTDEEMNKIFSLNKNQRIITQSVSVDNREYPFSIPFRR